MPRADLAGGVLPFGIVAALAWAVVAVRWTEGQDDVIRECSFRGAEFVAGELLRRCGVARSAHAVEMRASRIRCSLAVQTVCPDCGAVGLTLNRQSGLCPRCTERLHVEQQRAFAEQLEAERVEALAEAEELRRENAVLRKRNSRTCRKYGLEGRRARRGS